MSLGLSDTSERDRGALIATIWVGCPKMWLETQTLKTQVSVERALPRAKHLHGLFHRIDEGDLELLVLAGGIIQTAGFGRDGARHCHGVSRSRLQCLQRGRFGVCIGAAGVRLVLGLFHL